MICPNCKSEFVEGVYTCSDCGIPLVDYLPAVDHEMELFVPEDYAQQTLDLLREELDHK